MIPANTIILLTGFRGVGKQSLAAELTKHGALAIDRRLFAQPILSMLHLAPKQKIPMPATALIGKVTGHMLEAAATLAPSDISYIFTATLYTNVAADESFYREIEGLATTRQALFVPVRLVCDVEVLVERTFNPDYSAKTAQDHNSGIRHDWSVYDSLTPPHTNTLTLDTTTLSPTAAAEKVMQHINSLRKAHDDRDHLSAQRA